MNLNNATTPELDAYKDKVAGILGIDPMMLDYIWIYDPESGLRNQVLYAKRGAAEVMREQRKISITSLTLYESNGWIMFTAVGTIPSGRQEIAVGAAYVEGHRADKKAHAVMTAQTRAVRRLTLQFVGGGILDETEVQTQNELMAQPAASQATLAGSPIVVPSIPTVSPASAPGKDITPAPVEDLMIPSGAVHTQDTEVKLKPLTKSVVCQQGDGPALLDAIIPPPAAPLDQFLGQKEKVEEAIAQVEAKAKKTRAPRKPRNTVALASPDQQPTVSVETALAVIDQVSTPTQSVATVAAPSVTAVESVQPVPPQTQVAPPKEAAPDKHKEFKEKTRLYTNDILVKGNMVPSDGIGGVSMKFRKFAVTYAKVEDTTKLTTEQWQQMFDFLDKYVAEFGPAQLVAYMDKAIGAVK